MYHVAAEHKALFNFYYVVVTVWVDIANLIKKFDFNHGLASVFTSVLDDFEGDFLF